MPVFSNAQMEIIKLFRRERSEEELFELKQVLSNFLAKKLTDAVDEIAKEKGYTPEIMASWKDEHFRTPYK
jgi:hypothetical protein